MAELRRAQQRRRNLKRGGVVAVIVVIAVVLALVTSHHHPSKKKTSTSSPTTSAATSTTSASTTSTTPPTTVPVSSVKPLSLSAVETHLTALAAPSKSLACDAPDKAKGSSTTTTTTPAKGNAVSIVAAPPGVGFPKLNGSSPRYTKFTAAPPYCINANDTYTATMKTTAGTIVIRLLPKYAPQTVNSFVFLAGYHYFDGTVFHRVIPGFVDQGGDPTGTGSGGPGYTIPDEYPKSNAAYDAGAFAMANTGEANTGGSQFFIVVGNGGMELTAKYTDFGQIVSGLAVANKINAGGGTVADSGVPPKILYKIKSVTIAVTKGSSTTTTTTAPAKTKKKKKRKSTTTTTTSTTTTSTTTSSSSTTSSTS
jgi:cyclophilin family peptidyl-prolyl cis-trans isomerase